MRNNAAVQSAIPVFNETRPRLFLAYSKDENSRQSPQGKTRQETAPIPAPKAKADGKPTILLIEDQAGFRLVFRDALEAEGYHVLEAADGQSGWQKVKERQPDLVLLDLMLPKLHGFKVLENIRTNGETSHIPVIILSVLDDRIAQERGRELGANGFVVKSHSPIEAILNHVEPYFKSRE